jgi:hypothetical protein
LVIILSEAKATSIVMPDELAARGCQPIIELNFQKNMGPEPHQIVFKKEISRNKAPAFNAFAFFDLFPNYQLP